MRAGHRLCSLSHSQYSRFRDYLCGSYYCAVADEEETSTLIEHFVLGLFDPARWEADNQLAELDLTLSQARVLFSVARCPEARPIHTIADALGLSMTATGRNVDRLVRLGLLTRTESPHDRRVKLVGPTEHGSRLAWDQIAVQRATVDNVVRRLPESIRADLRAALTAVLDSGVLPNAPTVPCPSANPGENS